VLVRMAGGKKNDAARDTVAHVYETMGFNESVRAEEISPDAFVQLEQAFFDRMAG
jgi:16S rRNA A1518/A1519 N6-dimethyltransferase RsmA/KsgA/DIM1 with predicted DNA glycosylase/AP lyase activity